jgi:dihydroneopterin aldolase
MTVPAQIEFQNLHLPCVIGHYAPGTIAPNTHVLDLLLNVTRELLQVEADDMALVFDYDPLLAKINQIARAQHYTTQEYLLSRIVMACMAYPQILSVDARLRKAPVQGGSIGVRMALSAADVAALRQTMS